MHNHGEGCVPACLVEPLYSQRAYASATSTCTQRARPFSFCLCLTCLTVLTARSSVSHSPPHSLPALSRQGLVGRARENVEGIAPHLSLLTPFLDGNREPVFTHTHTHTHPLGPWLTRPALLCCRLESRPIRRRPESHTAADGEQVVPSRRHDASCTSGSHPGRLSGVGPSISCVTSHLYSRFPFLLTPCLFSHLQPSQTPPCKTMVSSPHDGHVVSCYQSQPPVS